MKYDITDKNKVLLNEIGKVDCYNIHDLKLNKQSTKFSYVSIFGDINCRCVLSRHQLKIELIDILKKELSQLNDTILAIAAIDSIRKYINKIDIPKFICIVTDNNINVTYKRKNIKSDNIKQCIKITDNIIINVFNILTDIISETQEICLYPGTHKEYNLITVGYIIDNKYAKYLSRYYFSDSSTFNLEYLKGSKGTTSKFNRHVYNLNDSYKVIIFNKNMVGMLYILNEIKLDKYNTLELCGDSLYINCDKPMEMEYYNDEYMISNEVEDRQYLGKLDTAKVDIDELFTHSGISTESKYIKLEQSDFDIIILNKC